LKESKTTWLLVGRRVDSEYEVL
jgi:hypothetical protein